MSAVGRGSVVKVVTFNIMGGTKEWDLRRPLLVDCLLAYKPDFLALQEVSVCGDQVTNLAEQLGMPHFAVVPYQSPRSESVDEGIAILSRHRFVTQQWLDLQTQGRVAQYVKADLNGQPVVFCNGHYYWHCGDHPERVRQVERALQWLSAVSAGHPVIVAGDFNATPETRAIQLMREHFVSAYEAVHGHEPDYTTPTPLKWRYWGKAARQVWRNLAINRSLRSWRGTLDYIFVSRHVHVRRCDLILNRPARGSRTLYPSDHFGIAAALEIDRVAVRGI